MPPRICAPGPATSRRASSRSARLPPERSRPIRTSSTSSGAACPTPRCPPGPTLSDQEVSDLAYFITTFSPDFSNPENVPKPVPLPSAPNATNGVHRAREEALRRDRLRQVPRHARPGRRTFGSNPEGRLGLSDTPGGPRAELDLPRRVVPRGYLPDDEHGVQRHAHAGVRRRRPEARAEVGDHRLHRLSLGEQRAWLFQPRRRQARPGSDRSGQGGRELRIRACRPAFRSSGRSWSPDARSIRPRPASPFRRSTMRSRSPSSFDGTT